MNIKYLSHEQILFIHDQVNIETGGSRGLLKPGGLESAVERPKQNIFGVEVHRGVYAKAAALFESITQGHVFVDGNKRAGITAASLLLEINGVRLTASNEEVVTLTVSIATGQSKRDAIASWFEGHSEPLLS
jgi:death on curing protein